MSYQRRRLAKFLASYKAGEDYDLRVRCRNGVFNTHRAVLRVHSPLFKELVDALPKEEHIPTITLLGDDPLYVSLMMGFLYTLEYNDPMVIVEGGVPSVIDTWADRVPPSAEILDENRVESMTAAQYRHAMMYALGEKYQIKELKTFALENFEAILQDDRDGKTMTADIIYLVFNSTPPYDCGLRDIITAAVKPKFDREKLFKRSPELYIEHLKHQRALSSRRTEMLDAEIEQLTRRNPGLLDTIGLGVGSRR